MGLKVSAIVSLYRGENYLDRFLANVADQTWFEDLELVIDHNRPTRAELEKIKRFQEEHPGRVRHLVREEVVPYGASWNRCLREASADIVTIWNVDDLRTPTSIEIEASPILSGEADLVFGAMWSSPARGRSKGA
jgi:glycosyltransferase involved in cell wall biosynthesis